MIFTENMEPIDQLMMMTEKVFRSSADMASTLIILKIKCDAIAEMKLLERPYLNMVDFGIIGLSTNNSDEESDDGSFADILATNSKSFLIDIETMLPKMLAKSCREGHYKFISNLTNDLYKQVDHMIDFITARRPNELLCLETAEEAFTAIRNGKQKIILFENNIFLRSGESRTLWND